MSFRQAQTALRALANRDKAVFLRHFFRTGKGEYAEGDRFLGIKVPAVRRIARLFHQLDLEDLEALLASPYNEERLLALLLLLRRYRRGTSAEQIAVYRCYFRNRHRVNNWNLVDISAPGILGIHLLGRNRATLYRLGRSKSLWDRRIAVLATFAFIRQGQFDDTLELTRRLLTDENPLMHKACGWMLREIGKRNPSVQQSFLRRYCRVMPRTMLRYAIERLPVSARKAYLNKMAEPAHGY